MKISYNWLKQFIKTDWNSEQTAALLTDLGLEVEVVEKYQSVKGGLEGIVVGHVLTCEKHPDAASRGIPELADRCRRVGRLRRAPSHEQRNPLRSDGDDRQWAGGQTTREGAVGSADRQGLPGQRTLRPSVQRQAPVVELGVGKRDVRHLERARLPLHGRLVPARDVADSAARDAAGRQGRRSRLGRLWRRGRL